jgi:chromosomal replication initiation ATPase DnaA
LAAIHGGRWDPQAVTELVDQLDGSWTVPQLNHLVMQLAQSGQPITVTAVDSWLNEHRRPPVSMVQIAAAASQYFGVTTKQLKGPSRKQQVVRARGAAILLARRLSGESLQKIGRYFGNRDHTTILHAARKTESLLEQDPAIRKAIGELTARLEPPVGGT